MNGMMEETVRHMPQMMGPTQGAIVAATGYAAGRGLLGGLLRNPWVLLATGVVAGYYIHKHQDEIMLALSKATGMGKDFVLQQKENLADLMEEAKEQEEQAGEQQG